MVGWERFVGCWMMDGGGCCWVGIFLLNDEVDGCYFFFFFMFMGWRNDRLFCVCICRYSLSVCRFFMMFNLELWYVFWRL